MLIAFTISIVKIIWGTHKFFHYIYASVMDSLVRLIISNFVSSALIKFKILTWNHNVIKSSFISQCWFFFSLFKTILLIFLHELLNVLFHSFNSQMKYTCQKKKKNQYLISVSWALLLSYNFFHLLFELYCRCKVVDW